MFLGPSPIFNLLGLPLHKDLTLTSVAYALVGIAQCPIMVPVIADLQMSIVNAGYANDINTASIVSGLFTSAINLGQVNGPFLGGLLSAYISFSWASTACAMFIFIEGVALLLFTMHERKTWKICCSKSDNLNFAEETGEANVGYNVTDGEVVDVDNGKGTYTENDT